MYSMLTRMSQQIPAIRSELEPIAALFVNSPRGTPKKKSQQPATPVATTPSTGGANDAKPASNATPKTGGVTPPTPLVN
jgi:hypothetical protein